MYQLQTLIRIENQHKLTPGTQSPYSQNPPNKSSYSICSVRAKIRRAKIFGLLEFMKVCRMNQTEKQDSYIAVTLH